MIPAPGSGVVRVCPADRLAGKTLICRRIDKNSKFAADKLEIRDPSFGTSLDRGSL